MLASTSLHISHSLIFLGNMNISNHVSPFNQAGASNYVLAAPTILLKAAGQKPIFAVLSVKNVVLTTRL